MITHGGGIHGFISDGFRFPDQQVYVSILTNCMREIPDNLAFKIGAIAVGKPYQEPEAIPFDPSRFQNYQGVYHLRFYDLDISVLTENNKLYIIMPGNDKNEIYPISETEFASKISIGHYRFTFDETGKANSVTSIGFYGPGMTAEITDKPLASQRKTIDLDPAALESFVGEYEIAPGMNVSFTLEAGKLIAQVPGQPTYELKAETATTFFLLEVPATFEFHKDAAGKVTEMTLTQSGQVVKTKKIK